MISVFWKIFFLPCPHFLEWRTAEVTIRGRGRLRNRSGYNSEANFQLTPPGYGYRDAHSCSTGLLQTLCLIHHRVFSVSPVKRFASPPAFTCVQSMQETRGTWPAAVSPPTSERRNPNSRPFDSRPPLRVSKAGAAWPCRACSDNPLLIKDYSLFFTPHKPFDSWQTRASSCAAAHELLRPDFHVNSGVRDQPLKASPTCGSAASSDGVCALSLFLAAFFMTSRLKFVIFNNVNRALWVVNTVQTIKPPPQSCRSLNKICV